MSRVPRSFALEPIGEAARNGRPQLVFGRVGSREEFALARWAGDRWTFPSGRPLHFEPEGYRP